METQMGIVLVVYKAGFEFIRPEAGEDIYFIGPHMY